MKLFYTDLLKLSLRIEAIFFISGLLLVWVLDSQLGFGLFVLIQFPGSIVAIWLLNIIPPSAIIHIWNILLAIFTFVIQLFIITLIVYYFKKSRNHPS
jgi:hypothetical protein